MIHCWNLRILHGKIWFLPLKTYLWKSSQVNSTKKKWFLPRDKCTWSLLVSISSFKFSWSAGKLSVSLKSSNLMIQLNLNARENGTSKTVASPCCWCALWSRCQFSNSPVVSTSFQMSINSSNKPKKILKKRMKGLRLRKQKRQRSKAIS